MEARRRISTPILITTLASVAFLFRLALVAILRYKQTHDLRIFVSWAHLLMQYGSHGLYKHVDSIDHYPVNYPPLFAIVLALVNTVYRILVGNRLEDGVLMGMLLKLPAVVADVTICLLVFLIVRRWSGRRPALFASAFAAFAPTTWPISAVWGQVDSISTAFMMLALTFVFSRRFAFAWGMLALAVLVKPLPIIVAPLLFAVQLGEQGRTWRLVIGPACAIMIAYLVSLPFAPVITPIGVLQWLIRQYASGQALTEATSVNAYNIWTIAWPSVRDSKVVLGLTLHTWGWLAFVTVVTATTVKLFNVLIREQDRTAREQLITRGCFNVLLAFFILQTRMHERYILFALVLAPLVWLCGRLERSVAAVLIVTFTTCVIFVLGFYEHKLLHEVIALTYLLSLVNVIAFVMFCTSFFAIYERKVERSQSVTKVIHH